MSCRVVVLASSQCGSFRQYTSLSTAAVAQVLLPTLVELLKFDTIPVTVAATAIASASAPAAGDSKQSQQPPPLPPPPRDSVLAFVLEHASRDPITVGIPLFWLLREQVQRARGFGANSNLQTPVPHA